MIDFGENLNGIVNIFYSAVVTALEIFFGPVIAVVITPVLQLLNALT